TLALSLDQALPGRVRVDEAKLRHVLQSLMARLISDAPEGEVGLKVQPGRGNRDIEFQVSAPTLVMSEPEQREVFQPFSSTPVESDGLGLGMVISQRIIEAMGGSL